AMKQAAKELDMVLGKWVDEHVEKRKEYDSDDKEADFIDVMLSTLSKDAEVFGFTRETIIKATTLNFEYIPFSSGRRMCPASSFALQVIHLTLARLLQGFDLSTPMGMPVDMTEGLGIA
nr:cytochrome P450 [Tanacetum cinerariifolium]